MTVDKSQHRVRAMFGSIAARYDFLNHFLSLGIDRYWRWRTSRLVRPESDAPLLDVCTGTGDLALRYWRSAGKSLRVVGADFVLPMLEIAREKVEKASAADWISLVEADAQRLPFSDGTFGVVSAAFGLRNVSDTDLALREMTRVCRVGGRVAVLEFSIPTRWPIRPLYLGYFRRILPRIGQAVARNAWEAYNYLPQSVGEFPQGELLAERMRIAGLQNVRFYPLTFGIATLYVGAK